jgi:hypothetical protein
MGRRRLSTLMALERLGLESGSETGQLDALAGTLTIREQSWERLLHFCRSFLSLR